jgi:plasmid maintenance system antidote protein VapI
MSALKTRQPLAQQPSDTPAFDDVLDLVEWLDENKTGELPGEWEEVDLAPETTAQRTARLAAMPPGELLRRRVAETLLERMIDAHVSGAELARRLGKSRAYVSKVLSGSENLTLESLAQLGHALECDLVLDYQPRVVSPSVVFPSTDTASKEHSRCKASPPSLK